MNWRSKLRRNGGRQQSSGERDTTKTKVSGWGIKHLSIRWKLVSLILTGVLFTAVVGATGLMYMLNMQQGLDAIYTNMLKTVEKANVARVHNEVNAVNAYRYLIAATDEQRAELSQVLTASNEQFSNTIADMQSSAFGREYRDQIIQLTAMQAEFNVELTGAVQFAQDGERSAAFAYFTQKALPIQQEMNDVLKTMSEGRSAAAAQLHADMEAEFRTAVIVIAAIVIGSLILCMAFGFWITGFIAKPVKELQTLTASAAAGDMTVRSGYASKDELGQLSGSFNRMLEDVGAMIGKINDTSMQVAAASQQLTASAEQTGKASEVIAESTQEVAAGTSRQAEQAALGMEAVHTINEKAVEVSAKTDAAAKDALEASELAREGSRNVQEATVRMEDIHQSVGQLSASIGQLDEHSRTIGSIATLITDIAGQTNLLALNASIEAARAGEQGRGFAVVASEVRKLAEQSMTAAQDVQNLVTDIQQQMTDAVQSMDRTATQVNEGTQIVGRADESFGQIENAVTGLAEQIRTMSASAKQMEEESERITAMIGELHAIIDRTSEQTGHVSAATEEQLATMEEMSASSQHLAHLAQEMEQLIGRFKR